MHLLIVIFLLCLLPSIQADWATKTVFPLIYGRKEIGEDVVLHDYKERYGGDTFLLGGEYMDNSSITKGFFMYNEEFGNTSYKYLYSTGTHDIIHKVALGSYQWGVGTSNMSSGTTFFIMRISSRWDPPIINQLGGDSTSIDPNSEIRKLSIF